jgi:hypothetical protein
MQRDEFLDDGVQIGLLSLGQELAPAIPSSSPDTISPSSTQVSSRTVPLARYLGVSRARLTQVLSRLHNNSSIGELE